jgi:hypothetical protein
MGSQLGNHVLRLQQTRKQAHNQSFRHDRTRMNVNSIKTETIKNVYSVDSCKSCSFLTSLQGQTTEPLLLLLLLLL